MPAPPEAAAPQETALHARPRCRTRAEPDACKHQRRTDTCRPDPMPPASGVLHPVPRGSHRGRGRRSSPPSSQSGHLQSRHFGPQGRAAVLLARGGTSKAARLPSRGSWTLLQTVTQTAAKPTPEIRVNGAMSNIAVRGVMILHTEFFLSFKNLVLLCESQF